jgi:streptogramin lyase
VVGGDGYVYLALNAVGKIARVEPVSGHMEIFDIPLPESTPKKGEVDSKGNPWFADQAGNALVKFDIKTKKITVYHPPTKLTGIYAATIDRATDYVWYCTQWTHQAGRFDPKTETWVEFYLPNAESDVRRCQIDQKHPNRLWWSGNGSDWMGYVELLP